MPDKLHLFVYRQGLLARFGHDLRLSARKVQVERAGEDWVVRVAVDGIVVDGAVTAGRLTPLGERDTQAAERSARMEVLHGETHPEVQFRGRREGAGRAVGTLRINDRSEPLEVEVRVAEGRVCGQVEIAPTRWGIRPYEALFGALRLQDRVWVVFDLALPAEGGSLAVEP